MKPSKSLRFPNDSAWLLPVHGRTNWELRRDMRKYGQDEEVDAVVIGCGAGGGVLTQRLARYGWKVVALEAGPFWDPDNDWVSDEAGSHKLYWTQNRVVSGEDPVVLGRNNSGHGVGGSMVHYAGYTPRFHPSDFRTQSLDGVGADWPLAYEELKPYYEAVELELPVAGESWPWGDPHHYPHAPHPVSGLGEVFQRGCDRIGIETKVGPVGIANGVMGNRPHCIYRGFCLQGCKVNAKGSPLITHVPDALSQGAEIRGDSFVTRIETADGKATGVTYLHKGREYRQRAKLVAVAGYSIESPRLLLNSGLCNEHDQVGRYVMVQGAVQVAGRFEEEVRMYKAPPPEVSSEQFYETDPKADYKRGFSLQSVGPLPIDWAEHVTSEGHWGRPLREYMRDYVHWGTLGILAEFLPLPENRVTLSDETDDNGIPAAEFSYTQCENDKKLMERGATTLEQVLTAAGATETLRIDRYAHLVGGCRMGFDARNAVCDRNGRTFAVPNLYIADGSALPTQGSANPALTIMALAARLGDHLGRG